METTLELNGETIKIFVSSTARLNHKWRDKMLTFTEWYEMAYEDKWHEDYADLIGVEAGDKYLHYCIINDYEPVWNG